MDYEVKKLLGKKLFADILRVCDSEPDYTCFKGKTVVITGASKLLGFYLTCSILISNDLYSTCAHVVAVDSDEGLFERYGKLNYRRDIDLVVSNDYSEHISDRADFVIHTEEYKNLKHPESTVNLLEFIRSTGASAVLCASSKIYGDVFNGRDRIYETDMGYSNCGDRAQYLIQAQRMAESAALAFSREFSADIKLCRLCKVYGAWNCDEGINEILNNALNGRNLVIELKKSVPQSYCYVTEAAVALLTVLLKGSEREIYNIASDFAASNFHIANECAKIYSDKEIKVIRKGKTIPLSPMAHTLYVLDCTKLKMLGFVPSVDPGTGVKRALSILEESR